MNVRFLEAFVWVFKLGSFKGAADRLHITQASISRRIATLEEHFGKRLFERDNRTVTLTSHGLQLLPYAERMIDLQARMDGALSDDDKFTGALRIGVIETVVHTMLPDLLSRFAARYPNVTLELVSDGSPKLREDLLRGALDCAITAESISHGTVENIHLTELPTRWIASPAMAARLPSARLSFADVAKHPLISFNRDSTVYRIIGEYAGEDMALRISYFSSIGAMTGLAKTGFGITILSVAVIQRELAEGTLVLLDVDPAPPSLPLIANIRTEPAAPLVRVLAQMARECSQPFAQPQPGGAPADVL